MAEPAHITRRDIEAHLITRAWKDQAFAAGLRRDPRAAIKVLEEAPTTLYLVIPPKPATPLSDKELKHIAGGDYRQGGALVPGPYGVGGPPIVGTLDG